jgi:hypothetical protein
METKINTTEDAKQTELVNLLFKRECRKQALQTSERLNPTENNYNSSLGAQSRVKPSITQVLADADKIYEWLTSELK